MLKLGFVSIILLTFSALGPTSEADAATYGYLGNPFDNITDVDPPAGSYETSMSVTGSVVFADELASNLIFQDVTASVQSFSMTDGRLPIDTGNSSDFSFFLSTDGDGNIASWALFAQSQDFVAGLQQVHEIVTRTGGSQFDRGLIIVSEGPSEVGRDIAISGPDVGSWSLVPEPGTALLLGMGLAALGARRRA